MKNKITVGLSLFLACFILICCKKSNNSTSTVVCTTDFRTVTIKVLGDTLDHFYTIRVYTGDTIRLNSSNIIEPNTYPVIDDSYQSRIANHTEQFRFVGIKNNNILVNEVFSVKADLCHIEYVSGNQIVTL